MPVVSTIKSSGGDFTTLAAWEAAKDGLGADTYTASCDAGFNMGALALAGWNSGSIIVIEPASGQEHNGVFTAGPLISVSSGNCIAISQVNDTTLSGLRVVTSDNTASAGVNFVTGGSIVLTLEKCILEHTGGSTTTSRGIVIDTNTNPILHVRNNAFKGWASAIRWNPKFGASGNQENVFIYNNTIDAGANSKGIDLVKPPSADADYKVQNNIGVNSGSKDFDLVGVLGPGGTWSHNASEDGTANDDGSTGALINQTIADLFTDTAADDYTLKTGSNAIGAGFDLSGIFTDSINGLTRSAPYDMGAYATAPATAPDLVISGNGVDIADGDTTPTETDHTDFGDVTFGSTFQRTYTGRNDGDADLTFGGSSAALSGTDAAKFTIDEQMTSPIAPAGTDNIKVAVAPTAAGALAATLTVTTNDPVKGTYDFDIAATGVPPSLMQVKFNGQPLSDGSTTIDTLIGTDFGEVTV